MLYSRLLCYFFSSLLYLTSLLCKETIQGVLKWIIVTRSLSFSTFAPFDFGRPPTIDGGWPSISLREISTDPSYTRSKLHAASGEYKCNAFLIRVMNSIPNQLISLSNIHPCPLNVSIKRRKDWQGKEEGLTFSPIQVLCCNCTLLS